jgi:hypothetical protein
MTEAEVVGTPRQRALSAAIVAAVIVLIGFGSGIGALLGDDAAGGVTTAAADAVGIPTVEGTYADVTGAAPPAGGDSVTFVPAAAVMAAPNAGPSSPAAAPTSPVNAPAAAPAGSTAAPSGHSTSKGCSQGALDAFMAHFRAAHLEESPGQQTADLLDVDGYTLTHTVLVEKMLDGALNPFMTHFRGAHLEESPGQQAADALDADQYTLTHTVLVENMLGFGGC